MAIGLDIGTEFIVATRDGKNNNTIRDAFFTVNIQAKQMLKCPYLEKKDGNGKTTELIIVGDDALTFASIFQKEVRRPLFQGTISPNERLNAKQVLGSIISKVLGAPKKKGEICSFSVPAASIDVDNDIVYHTGTFVSIVKECGYTPDPTNEAFAVILAECKPEENYTAFGISFGAGMTNVCLAYMGVPIVDNDMGGFEFSVARGGNWIDLKSAKALGITSASITQIKEKGIDLLNPSTGDKDEIDERTAIVHHYDSLIKYVHDKMVERLVLMKGSINLPGPVPIIISGGTSMPNGFIELFEDCLKKSDKFPFKISEVRRAKNPLKAVANGLLVKAKMEEIDSKEGSADESDLVE